MRRFENHKQLLNKSDFKASFDEMARLIATIQGSLSQKQEVALNQLKYLVSQTEQKLSAYTEESVKGLTASVKKEVNAVLSKLSELEAKIKPIKDGYTPRKGVDYFDGKDGKNYTITDKDKQDIIEEVRKNLERDTVGRRTLFGGRQLRMTEFSFTGDGATTTFTLPKEPSAKGKAIWAFLNGQEIQRGTHYTIARKILTTTFTPASGDIIEGMLILF